MAWVGLALLALALVLMMSTGWSSYAVLLGLCTVGVLFGLAAGAFDARVLTGMPGRVVGLLEHDLLQALVLYALAGALLTRLDVAGHLFGGMRRQIARLIPGAAPAVTTMSLGTLLAPMNGSVAASLIALSRSASDRCAASGMAHSPRAALLAVAGTLGVIVPPSLVLLLLGDAMLRAHTEGLNIARAQSLPLAEMGYRVMNTQDLLQAVLVPGALLLLGWLLVSARFAKVDARAAAAPVSGPAAAVQKMPRGEFWALLVVPASIALLLGLVVLGYVRAVEAAATACMALVLWGLVSRQLTRAVWREVLDDAMSLSGALFALLLAATTFTLLLRAFQTDKLVADLMLTQQGSPMLLLAVVLGVLLLCAFVLDAFEMIFLVIPIVMPPLLAQVGDAAWVATLALLVLQAGFLLPPFGYSVVLARGLVPPRPPLAAMTRALLPYLGWLACVLALTAAVPDLTHWLRTAPMKLTTDKTLGNDDAEALMRQMSQPRQRSAPP